MAIFNDSEIMSIIADVEAQVLGAAHDALAKAEGSSAGGPPEGSASASGGSAGGPPSDSAGAPPDASDPSAPPMAPPGSDPSAPPAGAPPMGDPSAAGAPPPGGDPSAAAGAPPGDPSAAGAPPPGDHEALVAEFAKMPPEHVAAIMEAAKQVLLAQQPAGGAPAPSPMEPSAAPAALAQAEVGDGGLDAGSPAGPMNQKPGSAQAKGITEPPASGGNVLHPPAESGATHAKISSPSNLVPTSTLKGEGGGEVLHPPAESGATHVSDASMLGTTSQAPEGGFHSPARKAELDEKLAGLEKANRELGQRIEQLTGVMTELVEKPIRKALTGFDMAFLSKPNAGGSSAPAEQLSKAEVTKRLNEKCRDPSLSKSDRDDITGFYCGQVKFEKIAHLISK